MTGLQIIYASTSGNTEYVVDVLARHIGKLDSDVRINLVRAEQAELKDLTEGDALILASGTWNMSGNEGQLNPHMFTLLSGIDKNFDLAGKPCAVIGLGDSRYRYIARSVKHLSKFIDEHNGRKLIAPLAILDEPYGQEERIEAWAERVIANLNDTTLKGTTRGEKS